MPKQFVPYSMSVDAAIHCALSDPTNYPPIVRHLLHDPCRTVFSVVSQTIAATPPLLSVKWPIAIQRQALDGGYRKKSLPLKPIAL